MSRRVVTIFGGSGFLGRHLVGRMAADGWAVRVAVRDVERAAFLKPLGDVGQITPWPADVTDGAQVAAAVAGADAVVNLIGILYERGGRTFERMHVDAARTIAEAAAAAGCGRLVHVSALGADPYSASDYARTKALGERAVLAACPGAVVLRPSVVFGPEDGFFNLFAGLMRLIPVMPVIGAPTIPKVTLGGEHGIEVDFLGDGGPKFQPVYVGDVADAVVAAIADPGAAGKTYELGGPTIYSFADVMRLILRETGRRRPLVPVPFWVAEIQAWFLGMLPKPMLTRDQVELLKTDNVVSAAALRLADLGVAATPADAILPTYLYQYGLKTDRGIRHA